MNQEIKTRLSNLREAMRQINIDVYIIPSSDPHKSEYVADRFKGRAYITGFTGSAGVVVITKESCHLWTDGRYFIQAEKQLEGSEIVLEKMLEPGVKTYTEWINDYAEKGMTIGYDETLFSVNDTEHLKQSIHKEVAFDGSYDLLSRIWPDRPDLPMTSTFVHEIQYTGLMVQEKLDLVRKVMVQKKADFYIISALNDIAWLFNIRANDVLYTPVAYAFALISRSEANLYIHGGQISPDVNGHLRESNIIQRAYDRIYDDVASIPEGQSIVFDPKLTNGKLAGAINQGCIKLKCDEITAKIKAVMHPTEIENLRNCQIKDGVALVNCLYWLDQTIGKQTLTELDVVNQLENYRRAQLGFIEPSFETISAYMANAAMMHYATDPNNSPELKPEGFLLLDSGGQYYDGTTDITRTIVLGALSEAAKEDFTLVLKGHINLSQFVFLKGTSGNEMDAIARQPIWQARKDYKSGTGHGVGYLLGVHEGIQRIGRKAQPIPLEIGMIITNEPGIYIKDSYGIRTENTLLVQPDISNDFGEFLKFETISFCPIDRRAINAALLTDSEKAWLNGYHAQVYDLLAPLLEPQVQDWLKEMTNEI